MIACLLYLKKIDMNFFIIGIQPVVTQVFYTLIISYEKKFQWKGMHSYIAEQYNLILYSIGATFPLSYN